MIRAAKPRRTNVFDINTISDGVQFHKSGGERQKVHGTDYHRHMIMLWILIASMKYKNNLEVLEFEVSIEDERYGKFDDFVFKLKYKNGKSLLQCIQLKHAAQEFSELTLSQLMPKPKQKSSPYSIKTYFESFMELQQESDIFKNETDVMLILYTNRKLKFGDSFEDFELNELVLEKVDHNSILNTELLTFKTEFKGRNTLINYLTNNNESQFKNAELFLQYFYIAHNQYSNSQLKDLINFELSSHEFGESEKVSQTYEGDILSWFQMKGQNQGTILNSKILYDYFDQLRTEHIDQLRIEHTANMKDFNKSYWLCEILSQNFSRGFMKLNIRYKSNINMDTDNGSIKKIVFSFNIEGYDQQLTCKFTEDQIVTNLNFNQKNMSFQFSADNCKLCMDNVKSFCELLVSFHILKEEFESKMKSSFSSSIKFRQSNMQIELKNIIRDLRDCFKICLHGTQMRLEFENLSLPLNEKSTLSSTFIKDEQLSLFEAGVLSLAEKILTDDDYLKPDFPESIGIYYFLINLFKLYNMAKSIKFEDHQQQMISFIYNFIDYALKKICT